MQAETPPTETRRRMYREPDDKKIAGVCTGLADYFGLDVRLVRLTFAVLALSNGIGLVAYGLAVLVIPKRPADVPRQAPSEVERLTPSTTNWLMFSLVVLAILLISDGDLIWFDGTAVGIALVGIGIWLLMGERDKHPVSTTRSVGGTTLEGEAASQSDPSGGDDRTTVLPSEPSDSTGPQGEVPPPVPPWGPTSTTAVGPAAAYGLPAGVFGVLLVVGGLLALLVVFDVVDFSLAEWIGALLLFVGIGLIIGAWRGRSRPLLGLGLPALAVIMVGEAVDLPLDAGVGDRRVEIDSLAELREVDTTQELLVGQLVIDLSEAPLDRPGAMPLDLTADLGVGELRVILPPGVNAEVDLDVDLGAYRAYRSNGDDEEGGVNVQRSLRLDGDEGGGRVHLDLHVGIGEIEVRRG